MGMWQVAHVLSIVASTEGKAFTIEATSAMKYGSLAALAIMVEAHCVLMETSVPVEVLRLLWHMAQLPEPTKLSVMNWTRGTPGSNNAAVVVVGLVPP
jgi:hypothetical protein